MKTHTMVYMDFVDHKPVWYVRIATIETKLFPHGIALGSQFTKQDDAKAFAKDVDSYLNEALK
jgi:hypothetical protein